MATAVKGPMIIYGQRPPLGSGGSENPNLAPGVTWGGDGLMDGRVGYNVTRAGAIGAYGSYDICAVDQVPSALSTTAMAAAQVPTAGVPLALVSVTGAGITVVAAATQVWASGNIVPAGSLAIDGMPALVSFGLASVATGNTQIAMYDPTTMLARNVRIQSVGNDSTATFTVSGADVYGYPQTEAITGANAGTASGKKAFKFIYSITPSGTLSGSNVSAGQGDVYGFAIRVDRFPYVSITWNNAYVTSPTGFTAADTTNPATSTTGDVRGTYAVQGAASNGTLRLTAFVAPPVANCNSMTGLFGVTPA